MHEQAERMRRERENLRSAFERQRRQMQYGYDAGSDESLRRQRSAWWFFREVPRTTSPPSWWSPPTPTSLGRGLFLYQLVRFLPFLLLPFVFFSFIYKQQQIPARNRLSPQRLPVHHDRLGRAYIVDSYGRKHRVVDLDLPPPPNRPG
eukprot:GHVQ01024506.1.p2 GENE.GHVQ01024506.1~~GHVQ01024506.1.p2  ORF type:complete len:148 (+),score=20.23 GHVQ01024506.1:678-1121(+)